MLHGGEDAREVSSTPGLEPCLASLAPASLPRTCVPPSLPPLLLPPSLPPSLDLPCGLEPGHAVVVLQANKSTSGRVKEWLRCRGRESGVGCRAVVSLEFLCRRKKGRRKSTLCAVCRNRGEGAGSAHRSSRQAALSAQVAAADNVGAAGPVK